MSEYQLHEPDTIYEVADSIMRRHTCKAHSASQMQQAYQAGRESMRQECLKECKGISKPWEKRNDPNGYCADAIKGIK